MSLKSLAKALRKPDGDGGPLVDHIYADTLLPNSEAAYITKYFDEDIRERVFDGSRISGGLAMLSDAAMKLKSAFQVRYAQTQQFKPYTAYHATKSANVANLIVSGGFRAAGETLLGSGVYFFCDRTKANAYATEAGGGKVLEVTIFSDIAVAQPMQLGADKLTLQTSMARNIMLVKNALLIFPKAVYTP